MAELLADVDKKDHKANSEFNDIRLNILVFSEFSRIQMN